jgi:hypothetical protein
VIAIVEGAFSCGHRFLVGHWRVSFWGARDHGAL